MSYKKLHKNARICMYIKSILATVTWCAVLTGAFLWIPEGFWIGKIICVALGAFAILTSAIAPYYRYRTYGYFLDTERIDVQHGFLTIVRSVVPIERIQNIEISRGPLSRKFGLAELKAVTSGGSIKLEYIKEAEAEEIADNLREKINTMLRQKHGQLEAADGE